MLGIKANARISKNLYKTVKMLAIATNMSLNKFILEALQYFLKTRAKKVVSISIPEKNIRYICFYAPAELLYAIKKLAIDATAIAKTGITIDSADVMYIAIKSFVNRVGKKHKRELKEISRYTTMPAKYLQARVSRPMVREPSAEYKRAFKTASDITTSLFVSQELYKLLHTEANRLGSSVVKLLKDITEGQKFEGIIQPPKGEKFDRCIQWVVNKEIHSRLKKIGDSLTLNAGHQISTNAVARSLIRDYFKHRK